MVSSFVKSLAEETESRTVLMASLASFRVTSLVRQAETDRIETGNRQRGSGQTGSRKIGSRETGTVQTESVHIGSVHKHGLQSTDAG